MHSQHSNAESGTQIKQYFSGTTVIERLAHRVDILEITGDSYRLKTGLKRRKQEGGEAA